MKAMSSYNAAENGHRSNDEAISELQREIDVRRRLYDRWIQEGRLSRVDAHDRLERMLTALRILVKHSGADGVFEQQVEHTEKVLDADAA